MSAESIVAAVRKHIAGRRAVITDAWPKHLKKKAYAKLVGEHTELERLETMFLDAVKKSNAAESETEEDDQ